MSKVLIAVGSVIEYPTIHNKKVVGKVEVILENTVIVRDSSDGTHVVLKSTLKEDGRSIDEKTNTHRTPYTRS